MNSPHAVVAPRPAAAWVMSIVSSLTLWVTEQLPVWVIAVQCIAFAVSYATRAKPPSFRQSPAWLNIFMLGITTVTIRSALAGNPATISLAYFTSLAQGLQLLDGRPRKSEFVLVALALFQVILASNLTDSVFFPPLLVVFLISVTWTLLVHTLSMEAALAGEPNAGAGAITPDLRRMTIVATVASLVLAALFFLSLPRLKTNFLRGGVGADVSLSGFSDRIALGHVGRIRKDPAVVLRVQGLEGELPSPGEAYWRGLAFDHFDGTNWSVSTAPGLTARRPMSGTGRFGIALMPEGEGRLLAQRILREPVTAGVLFTPGDAQRIEGPFQGLERDRNGGLFVPGRGDERIRYTIWSRASERDADRLRQDRARPPLETRAGGKRPAERYLQLPEFDPRVAARAAALVEGLPNDFEKAISLRNELRKSGRYTDSPPPLGDADYSPIEAFLLGELAGHCEYFASAMVVLARSQGLPSRLVNGFAGGIPNPVGGFIEVTRADAHAWVEIHFEQAGWVRFDPTPPDLRLRAANELSLVERLTQLGSAVELWWFQRVVDFDSADQIGALRGIWASWKRNRGDGPAETAPEAADSPWKNPLAGLDPIVVLAGFAFLAAAVALWRRPWRPGDTTVPENYRAAQRILTRVGIERESTTTARDFVATIESNLGEEGAAAFASITDHYLAERFGARRAVDLRAELAALQDAVDRMGLRDQADIRES